MSTALLTFLSLSLSGSLVALVLFLLKPLYRNRLSKTWQFYIYIVVLLRFLVPFGPDTGLLGMMITPFVTESRDEDVYGSTSENGAPLQTVPETVTAYGNTTRNVIRDSGWKIPELILLIWLVPACFMLLRMVTAYDRLLKKTEGEPVHSSGVLKLYEAVCREESIGCPPALVKSKYAVSPMLVGFFKPSIVLPDVNRGEEELRYALRHELTHYKRGDIFYKWLTQIMVCLHWFNPAAHWVSREIDRNCELSCDEVVIRRLNGAEKRRYGDMLLDMIKPDIKPAAVLSATLGGESKLLKERLLAIMKYKQSSVFKKASSVLLAVVVLCGAAYAGTYAADSGGGETSSESVSGGTAASQSYVYENVKLSYYDPESPYIQSTATNNTGKITTDIQCGTLLFDKDGNPLKLDWGVFEPDGSPEYFSLYTNGYPEDDELRAATGRYPVQTEPKTAATPQYICRTATCPSSSSLRAIVSPPCLPKTNPCEFTNRLSIGGNISGCSPAILPNSNSKSTGLLWSSTVPLTKPATVFAANAASAIAAFAPIPAPNSGKLIPRSPTCLIHVQ